MTMIGLRGKAEPCTWIQENTCTLGMWLVTGARQREFHPAWNQYVISAIHLREYEGQPTPAVKMFPEATHEIMAVALNPEHGPYQPIAARLHYLRPVNIMEQFVATSDDNVTTLTEACVRQVLDGNLQIEPEGIVGAREEWGKFIQWKLIELSDAFPTA